MYDDFYNEPSEFEEQIEEFKQSLMDSVKEEFTDEMELLRKENKRLQDIKFRMREIEAEHQKKIERIRQ